MYSNNKISPRQLSRMLILESIGISVLVSTEIAVHFAGRDGIFSILLAGIMAYIYGWFILWLCEKVNWNYWSYMQKYTGVVWRNIITLFFMVKYLFLACLALVALNKIVKLQVMDELNYIIIIVAGLAVCLYGVLKGIEVRGRLMEFVYVVTLLPVWVLIIFAIRGTDIYYITPLMLSSGKNIFIGAFVLFFLFAPIEMVLFITDNISSGDYKEIKRIKRGIYRGITYVLIVNLIIFLLNIGHLGVNTISEEGISTVGLMKTIKFSNYVLEKQSGIFLIFFITLILLTITGILGQIINLAWKISDKKNIVAVVAILLVIGLGTFAIINNVSRYENVLAMGNKRVEIENREYVDGILIDYSEDKYKVIMAFRDEKDNGSYKEYTMKDINIMEQEYKKNSDKSLDYSNLQAVIFQERVIHDNNVFRYIMDMLSRQQSIPENVSIYVTESNIEEFEQSEEKVSVGSYLTKLTKHNLEYAITTFRDIKNVLNDTEECSLLSRFIVEDGKIQPNGICIISNEGYICEYVEDTEGYIRMIYGDSGVYITIAGNSYRVDKNKYYINVKESGDDKVSAKIVYSGKITPMSGNELTQEEINILLEKVIRNRLIFLMDEYNLDLINIYKHMSAFDRKMWLRYNSCREEFYHNLDIRVQTEFRVINPSVY